MVKHEAIKLADKLFYKASLISEPRNMCKRYMNAMTLVQRFGKPVIFLIITCNPNFLEFKAEVHPNQEIQSMPELTIRIFREKLEELKLNYLRNKYLVMWLHMYM